MYSEQVLEDFGNPRKADGVEDPDEPSEIRDGPCCPEDQSHPSIRVADDRIAEIKHKTSVCPVTIVASSSTSVIAQGNPLRENRMRVLARAGTMVEKSVYLDSARSCRSWA